MVLGRREGRFQIAPGTRSLLSVAVKTACVTQPGHYSLEVIPAAKAVEEKAKGTFLRRQKPHGGLHLPWSVEKLVFTELEGRNQDVCFCCTSSVRPPLEKGGQGGLRGIAGTLGRCDNSPEDSRPGTAHQAVVTRGYPPCPPFSRGGRQRNPDEDKACARRPFHHPTRPLPALDDRNRATSWAGVESAAARRQYGPGPDQASTTVDKGPLTSG